MARPPITPRLLVLVLACSTALLLCAAAASALTITIPLLPLPTTTTGQAGPTSEEPVSASTTPTSPPAEEGTGPGETTTSPQPTPTTTTTTIAPPVQAPEPPAAATTEETTTTSSSAAVTAPQASARQPQGGSEAQVSEPGRAHHRGTGAGTAQKPATVPTSGPPVDTTGGESVDTPSSGAPASSQSAPAPFSLTPSADLRDIPNFFIQSFSVPPFLLAIYQAAGTAYGIPWQVLAAINEVETDYGRDLDISSAGAEGWMQFMPSTWARYGVDATGDGYEDPNNPVDSIFAAARYLAAAGGDTNIRAAIYAYNHSSAYVSSVMLRAELLAGTPSKLLDAIGGLGGERFPVHASSSFSDGFQTLPASAAAPARTLIGTTIYSTPEAPVIAVQEATVTAIGDSPSLGLHISLRDSSGNAYAYDELGSLARLYPTLRPRRPGAGARADVSSATTFQAGPDEVHLLPLRVGVHVIAGTILGHLSSGGAEPSGDAQPAPEGAEAQASEPHIFFQIRPAGTGGTPIDPKPILDEWVQLENSSAFAAGKDASLWGPARSIGQVMLESQEKLAQQVLRSSAIRLPACERAAIEAGRIDRRVLTALDLLALVKLDPTVSPRTCKPPVPARAALAGSPLSAPRRALTQTAIEDSPAEVVDISAIDRTPLAGHSGPGSLVDRAVRELLTLQGITGPQQIVSSMSYPHRSRVVSMGPAFNHLEVLFAPIGQGVHGSRDARAASLGAGGSTLDPGQWLALIDRLAEVPDPAVASGPTHAAIPDGVQGG